MSSPDARVGPDAVTRTTTLTRRGWSLTGAAFGLVIGSYLLGTIEMLVVGIAALVLVVAAAGWLRFQAPPTLAVSRRVHPDRLHVGSEGRIDLLVENLGTRATPLLAATDWFDEGRRAARFLVPPLAAGATARAAYRIPTRRRGRYRVGPLAIAVTDPFGVARRSEPSAGEAELVVRPRVHDIIAPVAVGSRISAEHEASAARAVVSDLGDEFVTLRDYELGDDLRRVHWRSTARTGELVIRQDEARWRSRAAVVLDVQPGAHDAASFEVAVEAAASVAARLARLRRRVELVTSAGEVLGTGGDPRHDVIDVLATVGLDERECLPTVFEQLRAHRRVDLVVAVLGRVTPDTLRALGMLSGIGVIVVLTQPAVLTPHPSVVVVDASSIPFPTAWNETLSRARAPAVPCDRSDEAHVMVRRARLVAPLALAALSAVAALSLGRVVDDSRFVVPVVAAALLPHALGALVRWRGWSVWIGWLLAAAGLVVYVVVALEASTTTLGLPGADTWHTLDTQLSAGWHLLRTAPAPAPTTDGAILLAVLAVWCMAALADWLAFSRQTALAAVSPALVFFVWTSTLGTNDSQLLLTVAFCVTTGAFLLAQNVALLDQRRSWLVSQRGARPHWLAPAALLGGAAIVVALVVAPLVPGSSSDPLLDVAGAGRDGSSGHSYKPSLAPFVDIGRKLQDVDNRELFTVKSDVPDYWRIAALDTYSGERGGSWTLTAEGDGSVRVGLPSTPPADSHEQDFAIGPLSERWLPAAYEPDAITLADTLRVESSGTIVADADSVSGLRYKVWSNLPPLAGSAISQARINGTAAAPPSAVQRFTQLPTTDDIKTISAKAREVTAGATTPFAQAEALRDFFRDPANGFVYDTNVDDHDDAPAILAFLQDKKGFCVQFASAYAVMARSLGIPARVAVGFTPGTIQADGRYHVTSHDAHAWPEIYLSGLGWTHLFDPTPSNQGTGAAGGSALPNEPEVAGATPTTLPSPTASTVPPTPGHTTPGNATPGSPDTTPPTPTVAPATTSSSSGVGAWLPVLVALAVLAVLVGGYVGAVLGLKRRRRNRRHDADDPAVAVSGAWAEALDRLHEADVVPRAAQTPLDLAATVPEGTGSATARPMRDLARAYGAARYGDGVLAPDDARDAWTSVGELERALDDGASWTRRWRRRLDPSTLVRR